MDVSSFQIPIQRAIDLIEERVKEGIAKRIGEGMEQAKITLQNELQRFVIPPELVAEPTEFDVYKRMWKILEEGHKQQLERECRTSKNKRQSEESQQSQQRNRDRNFIYTEIPYYIPIFDLYSKNSHNSECSYKCKCQCKCIQDTPHPNPEKCRLHSWHINLNEYLDEDEFIISITGSVLSLSKLFTPISQKIWNDKYQRNSSLQTRDRVYKGEFGPGKYNNRVGSSQAQFKTLIIDKGFMITNKSNILTIESPLIPMQSSQVIKKTYRGNSILNKTQCKFIYGLYHNLYYKDGKGIGYFGGTGAIYGLGLDQYERRCTPTISYRIIERIPGGLDNLIKLKNNMQQSGAWRVLQYMHSSWHKDYLSIPEMKQLKVDMVKFNEDKNELERQKKEFELDKFIVEDKIKQTEQETKIQLQNMKEELTQALEKNAKLNTQIQEYRSLIMEKKTLLDRNIAFEKEKQEFNLHKIELEKDFNSRLVKIELSEKKIEKRENKFERSKLKFREDKIKMGMLLKKYVEDQKKFKKEKMDFEEEKMDFEEEKNKLETYVNKRMKYVENE